MNAEMGRDQPSILVVDDEPRAVELLVRTLRREAQVDKALSGEEGWGLFQEREYDLVISDQRMPGMPGVELLRHVAEANETVGRILLTGYSDLEATVAAINRGRVHAYLHKPCSPQDLRLTVGGVLDRVRLSRENMRLLSVVTEQNSQLSEAVGRLKESQDRVVASERLAAIGRFASMVVHDLRSPLTVVQCASGEILSLGEKMASAEVSELARDLRAEIGRMQRLCEDLLDATRESQAPAERRPVALDELIQNAVSPLVERAAQQAVGLELDLQSGSVLDLDADRIRRVVLNLCWNAIEALPDGGTVRVESRQEADTARVVVRDNGPGIPPELEDNLFEPFVTHGKTTGTGLGLAIARQVVEDHGGCLTHEKPEGGGASLSLLLPLTRPRPS